MSKRDNMLTLNAFNPLSEGGIGTADSALIARRRNTFGDAVPLFYEEPLHLVRGEGVWLYDDAGRPYLDAYNNVPSVGHCHVRVVEAIARQASTLNTHTRYLSDVVTRYAERLLKTFPSSLSNVLFTNAGTESVDLAMRIARYHTGGTGFIVTNFAYHGNSTAVAEITPAFGSGVPIGANVRTVPAPDRFLPGTEVGPAFARGVADAIADLERHGIRFAGLVLDSICSSDGLYVDPPGFLQPVLDVVRQAGGVYIADEVQPGFGRMGNGLWGFARHDIEPDIVVLGKPMGNGMPIAATISRPEILAAFALRSGYFNTFGGNTVCCAAASAVLDVIEDECLIDNAAVTGAKLKQGFVDLMRAHASIGDVRGAGLYVGVEFVDPETGEPDTREALRIVNGLRRARILISTSGPAGNVLKIRPPLPFGRDHVDMLIDATAALLAKR